MHIAFDVPADPAYAGRVTNVLSSLYLRKFLYIGIVLLIFGGIGIGALWLRDATDSPFLSLSIALLTAGVLSLLFVPWVQANNRRRSRGNEVDGSYEITDTEVRMRSGTESHALPWSEVTGVAEVGDFWVLFVGRTPATVIPREFMTAPDTDALQAFLHTRTPTEKM